VREREAGRKKAGQANQTVLSTLFYRLYDLQRESEREELERERESEME